jgi:regulator of replication initiation timing
MTDDLTIVYQLGVEDMRAKLHKAADEIERLRAENEKLRAALKPFADAVLKDEYSWKYDINSDDFRAAAAAFRRVKNN